METVSIIIPAYNAEHFLNRCVTSIINQSYENLEIILINDGSQDSTLHICLNYSDARIQVIDQKNMGVAAARNVGLSRATGDYILFVDSDDWIEENMVETMIRAMQSQDDIDIVMCSFDRAEDSSKVKKNTCSSFIIWTQEKQQLEFLYHERMTGMLWNKLFRRILFEGISFDESIGYGEDAQMVWKVIKHSHNMIVLDDILYHHVLEMQSISNKAYTPVRITAILVWQEIYTDVKNNYPQWILLVRERLFATATYIYYEMKCAKYRNKVESNVLRKVVRENALMLIRDRNISVKMKAFAIMIIFGF